MQLLGRGEPVFTVAVEGSVLVRVLAVAQVLELGDLHRQLRREGLLALEPLRDLRVVGSGVGERLRGEGRAGAQRRAAVLGELVEQGVVVARGGDDRDGGVVLGRRADHGRATDVDHLHDLGVIRAGRHGVGERVEVADDEVDRRDVELVELVEVVLLGPVGEDPGVDLRVQRLDPAVEALREAGDVLDPGHRHAAVGDALGGRPGRDDLDALLVQTGGEPLDPGLVEHAHERTADGGDVGHGGSPGSGRGRSGRAED